ncbi:hypothetical protein M2336_000108 [Sphingobium sp. B1D7B]|nr:hypothetical protein [Sphingobium sp. B11D3A]MCW2403479.1 hypothetical protein [Sphingobium sp. B1D7B]
MLAMHTLYLSDWTLPASRMSRRSDLAETSPALFRGGLRLLSATMQANYQRAFTSPIRHNRAQTYADCRAGLGHFG